MMIPPVYLLVLIVLDHPFTLIRVSMDDSDNSKHFLTLLAMGGAIWPPLGNFAFVRKIGAGRRPAYYVTLSSILLGTF